MKPQWRCVPIWRLAEGARIRGKGGVAVPRVEKTVLSQEYLESFIDQAQAFLGNAAARDASRWDAVFAAALPELEEEETGLTVDRTVSSSQEESQRIKDVLALHGEYLDENIQSLERYTDTWIYGGQTRISFQFYLFWRFLFLLS